MEGKDVNFFNKHCLATDEDVMKCYIALNSTGTPHTVQDIENVRNILSRRKDISETNHG